MPHATLRLIVLALLALICGCADSASRPPRSPAPLPPHTGRDQPTQPPVGSPAQTPAAPRVQIAHALHNRNGAHHLEMTVNGRRVITPDAGPLHVESTCDTNVRVEPVAEGVILHFTVHNRAQSPAALPVIQVPGINVPRQGVEIIDNYKNIRLREPAADRNQHILHAIRRYPEQVYSPVMGFRADDVFLASSMMYDVLGMQREVNLDYRFDRTTQTWSMQYRFWDEPDQVVGGARRQPPMARLAPGETMQFALAVTAARPEHWVSAYRSYRDYFQQTFGQVRYQRSREPIMAISLGIIQEITDANPKGYNRIGAGGLGRMDTVGWAGIRQRFHNEIRPLGYRRVLFWQVAGSYRVHRPTNMVWEITSSWEDAMNRTATELTQAIADGLEVGFWWGRAFSISGGFDSGIRKAWNPDNPQHNAAAFRELDRAYELGVRLIGLDATRSGVAGGGGEWNPPADVLFNRIFPMLYERYPEMKWVIEPAACDFLHLWGSTFMWAREVHAPFDFADYIAPGHESHAVMKRTAPPSGEQESRFAHMNQESLDELIQWGYTPIVFEAPRFNLRVNRAMLAK